MSTLLYYDRAGRPISQDEMVKLAADRKYRFVKATTLANGLFVSTVWLGINHRYGPGPAVIFETMVFPSRSEFTEIDMRRYATEEEALAGHEELCDLYDNED